MNRLHALVCALCWVAASVLGPSAAVAQTPEPVVVAPAPAQDGSVMFVFATVEGERLELRQTRTPEGEDRYDARPIIEHLRGEIELTESLITVMRFQDGARLSIDMADGTVEANGQTLGKITGWKPREAADTWLDANAIAILTGTEVTEADDGSLVFTLDDRLRPQFDLELWVEGQRVTVGDVEPRTIGPVLLIPLRDVVETLGHDLEIDGETGLITVTRIQDTARIALDPATCAVAVNDRFVGVSPSMSYAEPDQLLFPASAIETLTGTHIKLMPGSNRVEITLDDRLGGGVLPDAFVLDQAKDTPFTIERIDYEFATEGQQSAAVFAHGGTLNGVGVVTTAGGVQDPAALRPSRITIDVESLRGWRASLGDVNSQFRELSGSGAGRVRGAAWRRLTEDGDVLAVAAGSPLSGSQRVSDSASIPTFSGFAAGARLIRPDRQEEIGLSAATENGNGRLVVEAQKFHESSRARDKAGLKSLQGVVALGAFQGDAPNGMDLEAQGSGVYRLSSQTQLRVHGTYRGASFLKRPSQVSEEDLVSGLEDETDISRPTHGSRTNTRVSLDWRSARDWTILKDVGAVTRASVDQTDGRQTRTAGVSVGGRIAGFGPNVSVDFNQSQIETDEGETVSATDASLRAFKRFRWGDAQLTYQATQAGDVSTSRAVATVTGQPIARFPGKGSIVSLAPSASLVSAGGNTSTRLGASLAGDSGSAFGDRFRMGGQISAAQSLDPTQSATEVFANVSGSYYVNRYIQLSGTVAQSLNGNNSVFLTLRGSAPFNPPRKHTLPKDGRGVLKGRAFLDRNRDGIRQDDEPGIPGIVIGLNNTRLRLGADRDGYFTIQNLKAGLYTLNIDRSTLPLGVSVSENSILRATVGAGQVTTVSVPVIASGQIRGSVYVDADESGAPSAGDERLEGALVTLSPLEGTSGEAQSQYAASFGQFAFESLSPGRYSLEIDQGQHVLSRDVELTENNLLIVENLGLPPAPLTAASLPTEEAQISEPGH